MRIIGWVCDVKITVRFTGSELRERLETNGIIAVLQ